MIQTEEKLIGEHTYFVTQLGALQGRKLLRRLVAIAGPALAELVKELPPASKDGRGFDLGALNLSTVGAAVEALTERMTEEELEHVCNVLAARTEVQLDPERRVPLQSIFDVHFAGRYSAMFQWLAFALEVNFRDFFAGSGTGTHLLGSLIKKG